MNIYVTEAPERGHTEAESTWEEIMIQNVPNYEEDLSFQTEEIP